MSAQEADMSQMIMWGKVCASAKKRSQHTFLRSLHSLAFKLNVYIDSVNNNIILNITNEET
jgi:hypothetical protein